MGSFSNYAKLKLLDELVGKTAFAMPTVYIALSTADPTADGSGIAEPTDAAYARIVTAAADWNTAAAGHTDNASTLYSPAATLSWGHLAFFAGFDAVKPGGNMLFFGEFTTHKDIDQAGDIARIDPGDLDITLT
jgi:hypothetical protein